MTKIKIEKEQAETKQQYPVTVSDWIVFLTSESSANISYYLSFMAVFIAITIAYIEFNNALEGTTKSGAFALYLFLVFILAAFGKLMNDYYTGPYQELSKKIIEGEITDPKKILGEYNKIENVQRKKLKNFQRAKRRESK